jgi:hypothetical protein
VDQKILGAVILATEVPAFVVSASSSSEGITAPGAVFHGGFFKSSAFEFARLDMGAKLSLT